MADEKVLSEDEVYDILKEQAELVKQRMEVINMKAALDFYSVDSGTYDATGGFVELGKNPSESFSDNTLTLSYTYSAGDLSVNSWDAPWGKHYPGSPSWAFDTGFVHGLHGGPRPNKYGKWSWNGVKSTTPIFDIIVREVDNLEI